MDVLHQIVYNQSPESQKSKKYEGDLKGRIEVLTDIYLIGILEGKEWGGKGESKNRERSYLKTLIETF